MAIPGVALVSRKSGAINQEVGGAVIFLGLRTRILANLKFPGYINYLHLHVDLIGGCPVPVTNSRLYKRPFIIPVNSGALYLPFIYDLRTEDKKNGRL